MILRGAVVTTAFSLIIATAAYYNGALSHVFVQAPPVDESGRILFDRIVPDMLKAHLPEVLMAVILLLVLSASMSTLSSLVLVSSSAVAIDLYKGQIDPDVSKEASLRMMRCLSGVFVVLSFLIAKYELAIIVTLMSLSWGAVAGAFLAPFVYGLYWRRATSAGAYVGMGSGLAVTVGLFFYLGKQYEAYAPMVATLSMIVPFVVVPLVSAFTPVPAQAVLDRSFGGLTSQSPRVKR